MSSNFPYVPTGVPLPSAPQSNDQLLGWAGRIGMAIQHLSRLLASWIGNANFNLTFQSYLTSNQNEYVGQGFGMIVPDHYEIALGTTLEIDLGGVFQIE